MSTNPGSSPARPESVAEPTDRASIAARNDAAMVRVLLRAVLLGAGLAVLAVVIAAVLGPAAALRGAAIGAGLSLVVTRPSLLSARLGASRGPGAFAGIVLGAWLVKMIVLVAVLIAVKSLSGISMPWIGIALLAGALVPTLLEGLMLLRARPMLEVDR